MSGQKAATGVKFFDAAFGGVHAGRCWTLSGPSGSGKSSIGLQFLAQGLREGERCLLLSIQRAVDTVLWAAGHGDGVESAIQRGDFLVLEYGDFVQGRNKEQYPTLPPEGFSELFSIASRHQIRRVALDTALPWAMTARVDTLGERALSLARACDRLSCTTLLTLPRPVSPMAQLLKRELERVTPINVDLDLSLESGQRTWTTNKYLGGAAPAPPVPYVIIPGRGAEGSAGGRIPPGTRRSERAGVRYAAAVFGRETPSDRAPDRGARFGGTFPR